MDSSGSIEKSGKGNYEKCLNFIKNAVNGSFISEQYTHVGLRLFSSKVSRKATSPLPSFVLSFVCFSSDHEYLDFCLKGLASIR